MALPQSKEEVKAQIEIYNLTKRIYESNLEWSEKYDLIFSDNISRKVDFEWCDYDTSYEEDVIQFMLGFDRYYEDKLTELEKIFC